MTETPKERLRVGDLAERTGKTVRALHHYEEMDLLRPVERSKGGYRIYGLEAIERVAWIGKLQAMGFSLPEVREFLRSAEDGERQPGAMMKVRAIFAQKLQETRRNIAEMQSLERELLASLEYLNQCGTCHEDSTPCVACEGMIHDLHVAPQLVTELQSTLPAASKA